jgi:hypothetical protein
MDILDANAAATNAAIDAATPMTTAGDLTIGGASGTPTRLGIGTAGQHLAVVAGAPAWAPATPMTAPGDLIVGGVAGAMARLGVGAETQALSVVGGVPTWVAPTYGGMTNPMTAVGDLILGGASGAANRFAKGADGQVLSVAAGVVGWAAPPAVQNLVTNPGFEVWQRGVGPFTTSLAYTADRWQMILGAGSTWSLAQNTTTVDTGSRYALGGTYNHVAASRLEQQIEDVYALRGRTVTFTIRVHSTVASAIRPFIRDSVTGYTYGADHSGSGAYQTLSVTAAVNAAATTLAVGVEVRATCGPILDNAVLVAAAAAPPYSLLHSADELARCLRYYEVLGSGVLGEPFALGQAVSAAEVRFPLRYAEKAVVPTVTASNAIFFGANTPDGATAYAFSALTASRIGRHQCLMSGTGVVGMVAGNASLVEAANVNARIYVTANPP